jgi:hypothetical protein
LEQTSMNDNTLKGLIGGIIVGAIAATGLTIGTGFSVVKGEAEQMAVDASNKALVEAFADICLARYQEAPDRATHAEALQKLEVYKQREYIDNRRWSVMQGSQSPYRDTADRCQEKIAATF